MIFDLVDYRNRGSSVRNVHNYCPSCIEDGKDPVGKFELASLSNDFSLCLHYGCREEMIPRLIAQKDLFFSVPCPSNDAGPPGLIFLISAYDMN